MSAILSKISPWIANTVFDVMTFDPEKTPKLERKTRIVQILSLPERLTPTVSLNHKSNQSYIRFTISDSKNHIPVYIPHNDNNHALNDELERLRHGSLVRLKHLQVSTHNLLGVMTNTNLNKPICLVVHAVQMNSKSIVHINETTSNDGAALESLGCENAGVIGNPLDVHDDIDVKRALIAMKYDHRVLSNQIIDCFNYIVSGPSFGTIGGKIIPGNDVIIGVFDSTNTKDEWSLIMNSYMNVNVPDSKDDSNDNESIVDENDQEPCHHSTETQEGQEDLLDRNRSTMTPQKTQQMAAISQMLGNSDSDESEEDEEDDEKIETQMDHGMCESQPDSNQDVGRLETQAPHTSHDDIESRVDAGNDHTNQSYEQESNFIETQGPTTDFECTNDQDSHESTHEKDDGPGQSSAEDEHYLETQAPIKIEDSPNDDKIGSDDASGGPAILQTQPLNTIGHGFDSDDDDYHSAHSDFIDDHEPKKKHIQGDGHLKENKKKKKKIMSVSTWLRSQSQSDPRNFVNEPWSQPSMDSQLSNGIKKRKVLSVSLWLKKKHPTMRHSANPSRLLQNNDSSKIPFDHENRLNYLPPSSSLIHDKQEDVDRSVHSSQLSEHKESIGSKRKKRVFSVSAWKNNAIDF